MAQSSPRIMGGAVILACAAAFAADIPTTNPTTAAPSAQEARAEPGPRALVEQAIGQFLDVLRDRELSPAQRGQRLDAILQHHLDFAALSRLMLGSTWTNASEAQKDAFLEQLSAHLMGVYLPMTNGYTDQKVIVIGDNPEQRSDHTVLVGIFDRKGKGNAERQIATVVCRLRHGDAGWKVIDLRIEGISVAMIFGAQFRPVVASEGLNGLIEQLRAKNAKSKTPGVAD